MSTSSSKRKRSKTDDDAPVEKRAARYRSYPTVSVEQRIERALHQRLYLISQESLDEKGEGGEGEAQSSSGGISRQFAVLGSTGNVYTVRINKIPSCDCPDFHRGNLCKHILFVFLKVLKVPPSSPLIYQKALLQSELAEVFEKAPNIALVSASVRVEDSVAKAYHDSKDGQQKPPEKETAVVEFVESDCAVCFDPMTSPETAKACPTCRNYLHIECLQKWLNHSPTCPYCRSQLRKSSSQVSKNSYLNLAHARSGH